MDVRNMTEEQRERLRGNGIPNTITPVGTPYTTKPVKPGALYSYAARVGAENKQLRAEVEALKAEIEGMQNYDC